MQNISCPIWHGNASGLAQQELEDEAEENDVLLSLVCCKWGTTLEENGLYGKEMHRMYVHNPSKQHNQTGYSLDEQGAIAECEKQNNFILKLSMQNSQRVHSLVHRKAQRNNGHYL